MEPNIPAHWADFVVKRLIAEKGDKNEYVCAAGITPSGVIHIGNFREIITVDLVSRAIKSAGKKARFIYSWDDYDVFRKVPKNMPKQEELHSQLRKAIVDVTDPFDTEDSYARHHEVAVETDIAQLGIFPEFLYQAKKYRACDYSDYIIKTLQNVDRIKEILNGHRKEPLADNWIPLSGFCPECGFDKVEFSEYDGDSHLKMKCHDCGSEVDVDIHKAPFLKLPWRVDWPMRWGFEKVDFEPGGKDHSTQGGSYTTAQEIVKIYDWTAPTYQMYDFIRIKGCGGKISSSSGDVITLRECLSIYEPEIVRWLFVGTRPNAEFAISFDLDVIKIYEDFDKCERIYYGLDKCKEKDLLKQKRIYELSAVDKPNTEIRFQPSFRHLTNVLQIYEMDIEKTVESYKNDCNNGADVERVKIRAECAKNWILKYAPEEFKFSVNTIVDSAVTSNFSQGIKDAVKEVAVALLEKDWTDKDLHEQFYFILNNKNLNVNEFFTAAYQVLISKEKGPQLANFILTIGKEKVSELFSQI